MLFTCFISSLLINLFLSRPCTPNALKQVLSILKLSLLSENNFINFDVPCLAYSITGQQSKQLESIQRQACQIILNHRKYSDACSDLGLSSLHERRHELSETFSSTYTRNTDNCLHYLLLDMRDSTLTKRFRFAKQFPLIFAKTKKFVYLLRTSTLSAICMTF